MKTNPATVSFKKLLKLANVSTPQKLVLHSATFNDQRQYNHRTVLKVPARTLRSPKVNRMLTALFGEHCVTTQYNRNHTRAVGAAIRYNLVA